MVYHIMYMDQQHQSLCELTKTAIFSKPSWCLCHCHDFIMCSMLLAKILFKATKALQVCWIYSENHILHCWFYCTRHAQCMLLRHLSVALNYCVEIAEPVVIFLAVCVAFPHVSFFGSRPSSHYFRSVCWFVCLFVCAEFFSAVFDPISIKLGHMLYVWV